MSLNQGYEAGGPYPPKAMQSVCFVCRLDHTEAAQRTNTEKNSRVYLNWILFSFLKWNWEDGHLVFSKFLSNQFRHWWNVSRKLWLFFYIWASSRIHFEASSHLHLNMGMYIISAMYPFLLSKKSNLTLLCWMPEILIYQILVLLTVSESFLTIESKLAVSSKNKPKEMLEFLPEHHLHMTSFNQNVFLIITSQFSCHQESAISSHPHVANIIQNISRG